MNIADEIELSEFETALDELMIRNRHRVRVARPTWGDVEYLCLPRRLSLLVLEERIDDAMRLDVVPIMFDGENWKVPEASRPAVLEWWREWK